ncbi:hypothetical protein PybrP1_012687 [[Pythium] brassicae (nom. inval.)]|nr:hypothetical protein PybrP1_012687 [[Pythium] brassicae (nom. inval.)]
MRERGDDDSGDGGDGGGAHAPLLALSASLVTSKDTVDASTPKTRAVLRPRPPTMWTIAAATAACTLLAVHVLFVVLLRKSTFALEQLTVPDLCHAHSKGAVVMRLHNPSYCTPEVGPLRVQFAKNGTALLELALPRFELVPSTSTLVADVDFSLLTSPGELHRLVFADGGAFEVAGSVPVRIYCMLVPFTVHINVKSLFQEPLHLPPPVRGSALVFDAGATPTQLVKQEQRVRGIANSVKDELERLVAQILKTIALSHIRVESDAEQIFAYTDVSFVYQSHVLWNLPSLTLQVSSASRDTILLAGFKRFLLGGGHTFISAFTNIAKRNSAPLQKLLQQYLGGNDVVLHVKGENPARECYSLQVLDLLDVTVQVPAKVDGKPAFLRRSEVHPTLKQLDSITHKCLLELDVRIALNNPLPFHFDLFSVDFDLLYKSAGGGETKNATLLLHVAYENHIAWPAHSENNLTLSTEVRDFDACAGVIGLYLHDELAFEIQHGHISVGAGSGNFTIPFSVKEIHIHPSALGVSSEANVTKG